MNDKLMYSSYLLFLKFLNFCWLVGVVANLYLLIVIDSDKLIVQILFTVINIMGLFINWKIYQTESKNE